VSAQAINWIQIDAPGALGIMPAPRGGDALNDEVKAWRAAGVTRVISALEPMEEAFLELQQEAALCERYGMVFEHFSIIDRSTPAHDSKATDLIAKLATALEEGEIILVHCRMGIGRSGMLCGATLVALGLDPTEAFVRVQNARGLRVPDTRAQLEWVFAFAEQCKSKAE
jgi:protein-tyrosine phosphatase